MVLRAKGGRTATTASRAEVDARGRPHFGDARRPTTTRRAQGHLTSNDGSSSFRPPDVCFVRSSLRPGSTVDRRPDLTVLKCGLALSPGPLPSLILRPNSSSSSSSSRLGRDESGIEFIDKQVA
jgi:hypothetical protein